WVLRDKEEFICSLRGITIQDKWIIDGSSIGSLEARYQRADLAIYICLPRLICLYRIFKRVFFQTRNALYRPKDFKEKVSFNLIKYLWSYNKRAEGKINFLRSKYSNVKSLEIYSTKELNKLLDWVNP